MVFGANELDFEVIKTGLEECVEEREREKVEDGVS